MDAFDEIVHTPKAAVRAAAKQRRRQQFIRVPWSWFERLRTGRGCTYRVALYLLYQHWKNGGRPVRLSNVALAEAGVSRNSKWRALQELEEADLIRVEGQRRKSPVVTVLAE